jgi:hypothetical protein
MVESESVATLLKPKLGLAEAAAVTDRAYVWIAAFMLGLVTARRFDAMSGWVVFTLLAIARATIRRRTTAAWLYYWG